MRPQTIEFFKKRLQDYKDHLAALEVDDNYKNHEEKRADLKKYYLEQIERHETKIARAETKASTKRANEITVAEGSFQTIESS